MRKGCRLRLIPGGTLIDSTPKNSGCGNSSGIDTLAVLSVERASVKCNFSIIDKKPISHDMLEESLGKEASLDILRTFLRATAELVVELQLAIRNKSILDTVNIVGELKHSSTVVGASGMLAQCIRIEDFAKNGSWSDLESGMDELVRETRAVGQFINQLLSSDFKPKFGQ